ncbi:hypothetical protein B4135_3459 [Caldibacillus debilis]|uniref:Uncharacterized protein n=1 Tax=Caldibacillus debilis TaxID=301148 RepID=A0A150LDE6_9BACI|nr:hypothetical protein B4135_3459 [Caldibacillus debilis]
MHRKGEWRGKDPVFRPWNAHFPGVIFRAYFGCGISRTLHRIMTSCLPPL